MMGKSFESMMGLKEGSKEGGDGVDRADVRLSWLG